MADNVKVQLLDGMHFAGTTPAGEWVIPLDSDTAVGGQDLGHRPLSLMLISLLGCVSMDVVSILRKKRQDFSYFNAEVTEIVQAEQHPHVFEKLHLHFQAGGAKVTEEALARSLELSFTKYCPASAMLRASVDISYTYEIVEVMESQASL